MRSQDRRSVLRRRRIRRSDQVAALGIDRKRLMAQSLITPACGMGTLSLELTMKALRLTRELSNRIRTEHRA